MNARLTLHVLGGLLLFLAAAFAIPIVTALIYTDPAGYAFAWSALATAAVGGVLFLKCRSEDDLGIREGFAIVTFGWLLFGIFGALPYLVSGAIPSPIVAFFESVSGFTTTGSTILTDI